MQWLNELIMQEERFIGLCVDLRLVATRYIVWQRRELLRGLIVFVTVILLLMATTRHLVREIHLEGYTRSQDRNIAVLICGDPDKEAV